MMPLTEGYRFLLVYPDGSKSWEQIQGPGGLLGTGTLYRFKDEMPDAETLGRLLKEAQRMAARGPLLVYMGDLEEARDRLKPTTVIDVEYCEPILSTEPLSLVFLNLLVKHQARVEWKGHRAYLREGTRALDHFTKQRLFRPEQVIELAAADDIWEQLSVVVRQSDLLRRRVVKSTTWTMESAKVAFGEVEP